MWVLEDFWSWWRGILRAAVPSGPKQFTEPEVCPCAPYKPWCLPGSEQEAQKASQISKPFILVGSKLANTESA